MQTGYYTKQVIDYEPYRVPFFHFPKDLPTNAYGCGANALHILTRIHPSEIHNKNGGKRHYSDRFMVSFLRQNGYTVKPLTKCSVSLRANHPLRYNHVILVSQLMLKNEASWTVIYGGQLMHNEQRVVLSGLEFINRPVLSAYVIYHPSWMEAPKVPAPAVVETSTIANVTISKDKIYAPKPSRNESRRDRLSNVQ